jgi:hypothetical protein
MGAEGRAVYEREFTLDHTVTNTLAVYQAVLKRELHETPATGIGARTKPDSATGTD